MVIFQWLCGNKMKANTDKCHFIYSFIQKANLTAEDEEIANNVFVKLLVLKIDSRLTFNTHVNDVCEKAGQKLNAFEKITLYLDFTKKVSCWCFFSFTM